MRHAGQPSLQAQPGHKKGDVQVSVTAASPWPTRPSKTGARQLSVLYGVQKEILQLMADGYTYKEIAFTLDTTEACCKYYASFMYKQLRDMGFHVVDKASAVALGLRQGWIK